MDWIEITGATVDAAVELALDSLGVHESELEYQVVEEPRKGFLGLGRAPARIRARVRPISREKPSDRRRRKRADQRRSRGNGANTGGARTAAGVATPGSDADAATTVSSRPDGAPTRSSSRRRRRGSGATKAVAPGVQGGGTQAAARGESSPGPADRPGSAAKTPRRDAGTPATAARPAADRHESEEQRMSEATISVDEQLAEAREFTEGLLDAFGIAASVRGVLDDGDIQIDIEGDALGVLVGPKGATLSSIEELVRTAVLVRAGGFGARIHVDVAGYRRRRREALAGFATKLAEDVLATGVAKALEPMSASDRKVVHDTVGEIAGVATSSEGDEPRRRVVIRPE